MFAPTHCKKEACRGVGRRLLAAIDTFSQLVAIREPTNSNKSFLGRSVDFVWKQKWRESNTFSFALWLRPSWGLRIDLQPNTDRHFRTSKIGILADKVITSGDCGPVKLRSVESDQLMFDIAKNLHLFMREKKTGPRRRQRSIFWTCCPWSDWSVSLVIWILKLWNRPEMDWSEIDVRLS